MIADLFLESLKDFERKLAFVSHYSKQKSVFLPDITLGYGVSEGWHLHNFRAQQIGRGLYRS
jgi:hypothetical protein